MVVVNPAWPVWKLGPAWGRRAREVQDHWIRNEEVSGSSPCFARASKGLSFPICKSSHCSIRLASYDKEGMGLPAWRLGWRAQHI